MTTFPSNVNEILEVQPQKVINTRTALVGNKPEKQLLILWKDMSAVGFTWEEQRQFLKLANSVTYIGYLVI